MVMLSSRVRPCSLESRGRCEPGLSPTLGGLLQTLSMSDDWPSFSLDIACLEYVIRDDFQIYKSGGILISLLLIALFQSLLPNRLVFRQLLGNWKVNCSVAFINTLLTSLLCGACVCTWAVTVRESGVGFLEIARFPYWSEVAMTIILLDFVAWTWHRAIHDQAMSSGVFIGR